MLRAITGVLMSLVVSACSEQQPESTSAEAKPMSESTNAELKTVASARIFFQHQSVGSNMLDGLADLYKSGGQTGNIVHVEKDGVPTGPAVIHSTGGRNTEPDSKIEAFAESLRTLEGLAPDVALMKLCYIDVVPETDVEKLFQRYRATLQALQKEFPEVLFAHATVPLSSQSTEMKDRIYRTIGKEVWGDAANIKRNHYNRLLREEFPDAPIVDIARAESTRADGSKQTFSQDGESHACMVPAYTSDGGHLNPWGKRVVAEEMARALAGALTRE